MITYKVVVSEQDDSKTDYSKTKEIYTQTVDTLDVVAVINAVNKKPAEVPKSTSVTI